MNLKDYILKTLNEIYPLDNITDNTVRDYILDNKISVMNLINNAGPHTINPGKYEWAYRLALALNVILMDKYESIPEFLANFNIDEPRFISILKCEVDPGKELVIKIIEENGVRPSYIFQDNPKMFKSSL